MNDYVARVESRGQEWQWLKLENEQHTDLSGLVAVYPEGPEGPGRALATRQGGWVQRWEPGQASAILF